MSLDEKDPDLLACSPEPVLLSALGDSLPWVGKLSAVSLLRGETEGGREREREGV